MTATHLSHNPLHVGAYSPSKKRKGSMDRKLRHSPLHVGAYSASLTRCTMKSCRSYVTIPFTSGLTLLPNKEKGTMQSIKRHNPLHVGAYSPS